MTNLDLAYDETTAALNTRIRAHQEFSTLKVEDVLEDFLAKTEVKTVLDVGCGSGNYSLLFARKSKAYVGMDKSADLLSEARARCEEAGAQNALFMQWDMNVPFPFVESTFDLVFFGYSAYYVDDVRALIHSSRNALKRNGQLCIVGPVAGNAVELDRVTEKLLGTPASEEKETRMNRLEREFVPAMRDEFGNVDAVTKDFSLLFPTVEEYRRYYLATPQLLELAKRTGRPSDADIDAVIAKETELRLTKRSIFLWSSRS